MSKEIDSFKRSLEEEGLSVKNIQEIENSTSIDNNDRVRLIKVTTDSAIIYYVITGFYWNIEYESTSYNEAFEQFAILTDGVDWDEEGRVI